jgi:hypothetical protein
MSKSIKVVNPATRAEREVAEQAALVRHEAAKRRGLAALRPLELIDKASRTAHAARQGRYQAIMRAHHQATLAAGTDHATRTAIGLDAHREAWRLSEIDWMHKHPDVGRNLHADLIAKHKR